MSADHLSIEAAALYGALRSFEFDSPGVEFTFAKRLAAENGWPPYYTERVIEEYRRFLVLLSQARGTISPSDAVDQAWHLYMIYSRSYWDELCGRVLKRPVHHDPVDGGGRDREAFMDQYTRALADYRQVFGEEPPADIWPSPKERFAVPPRYQRVAVESSPAASRAMPWLRLLIGGGKKP